MSAIALALLLSTQIAVDLKTDIRIDQKLGAQLPLDTPVVDEQGRTIPLGDLIHDKPVIFSLVYYECPMLCTLVMNGLIGALKTLTFTPGKEFDVVTVSIDPNETPALARAKKTNVLNKYANKESANGWHLLTASEGSIKTLAEATGFHYKYDPEIKQYAHGAAIMVITPEGKIAQYFYGVEYSPRDIRLALIDASKNKIGNLIDTVLLYCYHYDPVTGRYGIAIMNTLRIAGALTVILLGGFVAIHLRRERKISLLSV